MTPVQLVTGGLAVGIAGVIAVSSQLLALELIKMVSIRVLNGH
jgi:hypothetical protein